MAIASFNDSHIRKIGKILADAYTHRELSDFLRQRRIVEQGGDPKREHVLLALRYRQQREDQRAAEWAINIGPQLLAALDKRLG